MPGEPIDVGELVGEERIGPVVLPTADRLPIAVPTHLHRADPDHGQLRSSALFDDGDGDRLQIGAAALRAPRGQLAGPLLAALAACEVNGVVGAPSGHFFGFTTGGTGGVADGHQS